MSLATLIASAQQDERGYLAWDDMGVEVEVAEFLHSLVRLLKPQTVVEAGTGNGYAAYAIATALERNGSGLLHTFEPLEEFWGSARKRLEGLPAQIWAGYSWQHPIRCDFVFVDSFGDVRQHDLDFWLAQSVAVAVHDARSYDLPSDGIHFDTPRGLWLRT